MPVYADGGFRERADGILEYRFMHDGERVSVYGSSRKACWDKRTDLIAGKKKIKKEAHTFGQWLDEWYDLYKKPYNGERSLKTMRNIIDNQLGGKLGKISLKKLEREILQKYINKYAEKPNMQKKLYDVINGSLKMAVAHKLIKYNPSQNLILTPYKPVSYKALEFHEQHSIYNGLKLEKYQRLFFFLCCTGIRISRALELEVKDFDFERMQINVLKKQKKGQKQCYYVPFLPELIKLPQKGKVFADITYAGARLYFDKLFTKLKIDTNLHACRHTFISVLHHLGVDDKQIQLWAGHSTLAMTTDIYTHLLPKGNSLVLEYLKKIKGTYAV